MTAQVVDRGRESWSWIAGSWIVDRAVMVGDRAVDRGSWSWIVDRAVVIVDRGREIHRCGRGRRSAISKIQQAWKIRSWSWISLVELNIPMFVYHLSFC